MLGSSKTLGLILTFVLFPMVILPHPSWGQGYPTKPIQLILCWPPGGFTPTIATLLTEESKRYFSKPVIQIYKPGASGTIGAYYVSKAPPDGYTILVGNLGNLVVAPLTLKVEYSPFDFEIAGQIARNQFTFVVKADSPWKNLRDVVRYAQNNPGLVTCGNSGTNGSQHMIALKFEQMAGIKLTHVPFKGGSDSMANVAGGHSQMGIRVVGEGEPLVDAGKVRVLTIIDSKRCPFYPDVPSIKEEGYDLEAGIWVAIFAPKGTPKSILKTWEDVLQKVALDKAFIEKATKMKMNIEFKSAENFKETFKKEVDEFDVITRKLGLKPM